MSKLTARPVRPPPGRANAVTYAREASVRQGHGALGIQDQILATLSYCQEQGWNVVGQYADAPASGMSEDRPDLQKMMEHAEQGGFKFIVVKDLARLFRDPFLGEMYRRRLAEFGVEIVILNGPEGQ